MMTDEKRKAWKEDVAFAKSERGEHPEIAMNVMASTILWADAEMKRLREAVECVHGTGAMEETLAAYERELSRKEKEG
jgi:hypothetical protein